MPELPDVEGYCRLLRACLSGSQIRAVDVYDAGVLRNCSEAELVDHLVGREVGTVHRLGKWILVPIGSGETLLMHLGMTGLVVATPLEGPRHRFDRLCLTAEHTVTFRDRRRLGGIWLAADQAVVESLVGDLGPDARGISAATLAERLRATRRPVKTALVDQSVVAGLGNMLSDEVLWSARIHPGRPAGSLTEDEIRVLHEALGDVLRRSIRAGHIPRTKGWLAGQRAAVEPACPRCGDALVRFRVGDRRALICPVCQTTA